MKRIALTIMVLLLSSVAAFSGSYELMSMDTGTLKRAEKMTEVEIARLRDARAMVTIATDNVNRVERDIAKAHGMERGRWMEWESWWEIDGDFILSRYRSSVVFHLPESPTILITK